MSELARAIIVDSSSAFAVIMIAFFALLGACALARYVYLANRGSDHGKARQVQLEHEEKMAELQARYPVLLGRDVAEKHKRLEKS